MTGFWGRIDAIRRGLQREPEMRTNQEEYAKYRIKVDSFDRILVNGIGVGSVSLGYISVDRDVPHHVSKLIHESNLVKERVAAVNREIERYREDRRREMESLR